MNSDTKRLFSKFDTRGSPDLYQHFADGQLRNRLTNPSVVITVALLVVTLAYQAAHQQRRLPSILQLLWGATVTVIPARLLFALDRLINPPLFPLHMLKPQPPTRAAKSDALRRILGMDNGGGIIGSVSQVGRKGLSSISGAALGSRAAGDQPPGLGNYDNSCYQNSILQGLASLKHLPAYLSAISHERRLDLAPTRTVDTLRELMAELTNPSSNGRTLWTPKVLKNMSTWQQQDAQEYYSKLLDQIDSEIAKAARALKDSPGFEPDRSSYDSSASQHSDDSGYHSLNGHSKLGIEPRLARSPLEGFMAQRVACVNCGHCEGLTMIPFNCLTLTLGSLPEHDLYERLDHYTKVESIEGVECLKCSMIMCRDLVKALAERTEMLPEFERRLELLEEALEEEAFDEETLTKKCNIPPKMRATSTKTKQVVLARPPQSLVFHVNRSGFDEQTGYMFKNSAAVRFPMVLDMGPWCLGSTEGRANVEDGGAVAARDVEQWTLDPKSSMVAGDREPSRITGPIYELRAVVTHYGHHENGHYVCYRKHPRSSPPTIRKGEGPETSDGLTSEEHAVDDGMDLDHETGPREDGSSGAEADGLAPGQDEPQSQWWRLSDEDVTQVDERTVLSQGGVFMLFYDCVDPNSVLVSDLDKSADLERAAEDTAMQDEAPTPCLLIQSSSVVQQNGGPSIDSDLDSSMQLDDNTALPLPGIATAASELSETPGLDKNACQPRALSPEPEEPVDKSVPGIQTLDPAKDQSMGQPSADSMTQPIDGLLLPQSLARIPEV